MRHNEAVLDWLYILDNDSSDGTLEDFATDLPRHGSHLLKKPATQVFPTIRPLRPRH